MKQDLDFLLSAIALRDVDAFAEWMSHAEMPLRLSLSSFARVVDTEAVVQETLIRVWSLAPRFEPDGAPNALFRFAVRVARNLAVSEVRRVRRAPVADFDDTSESEGIAWVPPDPLLREAIRECHDKLPSKPREALDARLVSQGGEADEVLAERLSMRLNTFLQNFTRARKFLAECLGKRGIETDPALSS